MLLIVIVLLIIGDGYYTGTGYTNISQLLTIGYEGAKSLTFNEAVFSYSNQYGQGVNVRLCLSQWYCYIGV